MYIIRIHIQNAINMGNTIFIATLFNKQIISNSTKYY